VFPSGFKDYSMLSTYIFATLFYLATAILIGGVLFRIYEYWKTPAPYKIPTMPAPRTQAGAYFRVGREVVLFESLFKSNKWIWIFGWMFHFALLLVLLRHLRYGTDPVWTWVQWIQPFGMYAGFAMMAGLGGLLARRLFVERIRYITTPSDNLILLLLMAIAGTGLAMKFVAHTDIIAVKAFMLGLTRFDWQPLPNDPLLYAHFALVIILMIIFPISKLLHAPGIFFSPTRNQADNSREKRHVADWAKKLDEV
jgi:nitrate reductase gamma subunit